MSHLAKLLSTLGRLYPLYSGYKKVANSKLFRWSVGNNTGVVWTPFALRSLDTCAD